MEVIAELKLGYHFFWTTRYVNIFFTELSLLLVSRISFCYLWALLMLTLVISKVHFVFIL